MAKNKNFSIENVWRQEDAIVCPCAVCGAKPMLQGDTIDDMRTYRNEHLPLCEEHGSEQSLATRLKRKRWDATEALRTIDTFHKITLSITGVKALQRLYSARVWLSGEHDFAKYQVDDLEYMLAHIQEIIEKQTTSSDLAEWGTFRWDARATDGTLWTGTQTSEANAQHSSEAVFIYASVPNVVLTSPVQGETYAGSVSVSWQTIPNQQAWRVVATDVETGAQITQGDWNQNTNTATSLSASSHGLRKGRSYDVFVELRDTNSLVGSSSPIQFLIDYPLPSPIDGFVALPQFQNLDTQPSSIQMTWEPYEGSDFERYTISRSIHGVPLTIARITNPNETWFTDLVPPSDSEIEYSIVLSTLAGIDEIDSEPAYATAQIEIEHVILQSAVDPNQRSILNMDSEREYEHANDGVMETPWGASAPVVIYGTAIYQRFSGEFSLVSDHANSARDHINALRRLWNSRQTICYRDERGRRFFGQITRFTEVDNRVDTYTVSLEITETTYNEGVSDG